MRGAFGGDQKAKDLLLARFDAYVTAGTLVLDGGTWWKDGRASPMALAIGGIDPADYARVTGYPLPLAALLDMLGGLHGEVFDGAAFARDWIDAVAPGADLSLVPARLLLHMLAAEEMRGWDDDLNDLIAAQHRAACEGRSVPPSEWTRLRARVVAIGALAGTRRERAIAATWAAACWPADRGRSVLVSTLDASRRVAASTFAAGWSAEREARADELMKTIWAEQQPARDAGADPAYLALFHKRDPLLALGFEGNLARSNRLFISRGTDVAQLCLALFRQASQV